MNQDNSIVLFGKFANPIQTVNIFYKALQSYNENLIIAIN
jgi:hypothetical protein